MSSSQRLVSAISKSSLLWGGVATCGFYSLVELRVLHGPLVQRYFASHPVEYVATALFFAAAASLVTKLLDLIPQLRESELGLPELRTDVSSDHVALCDSYLAQLDQLPLVRQRGYLAARVREAIEAVRRTGHAERLGDELKYLADLDAARSHASYGLVRIIVWAIPILGFLGTVIGITLAIANLSPEALEESLTEVTAGLGVAFDTTALALALSIVLMFGQFITSRIDGHVLDQTDTRAAAALAGRFASARGDDDPAMRQLNRVTDALVASMDQLVERQAALWQTTIEAAHHRWARLADGAQNEIEAALTAALETSAERHAATHQQFWSEVAGSLTACVRGLQEQQNQLSQNGQIMLRVLDATGQVRNLEQTLNENLHALSQSKNFENTLLSLAANVNVLAARLGLDAPAARSVDLASTRESSAA